MKYTIKTKAKLSDSQIRQIKSVIRDDANSVVIEQLAKLQKLFQEGSNATAELSSYLRKNPNVNHGSLFNKIDDIMHLLPFAWNVIKFR
jgi:hypothetical protein